MCHPIILLFFPDSLYRYWTPSRSSWEIAGTHSYTTAPPLFVEKHTQTLAFIVLLLELKSPACSTRLLWSNRSFSCQELASCCRFTANRIVMIIPVLGVDTHTCRFHLSRDKLCITMHVLSVPFTSGPIFSPGQAWSTERGMLRPCPFYPRRSKSQCQGSSVGVLCLRRTTNRNLESHPLLCQS